MIRSMSRTGGTGRARRSVVAVALVAVAALVLGACQPEKPSEGRGTPIRKVLIVGDSMTFGVFGTTPLLRDAVWTRLKARGVDTRVVGAAGSTLVEPWPGRPSYAELVRTNVASLDPDVVIIQSTLFPGGADPARHDAYIAATQRVISLARARGAHVYLVDHHDPREPDVRREKEVAQYIQAVVAGPGVSHIPLDWWIANCRGGTVADGWHLSAAGQECHAQAIAVAIDQLKARNG